jgi:hypothetical protein
MRNNLNSGAELLHPEFRSRAALGWSRAMPNTPYISIYLYIVLYMSWKYIG